MSFLMLGWESWLTIKSTAFNWPDLISCKLQTLNTHIQKTIIIAVELINLYNWVKLTTLVWSQVDYQLVSFSDMSDIESWHPWKWTVLVSSHSSIEWNGANSEWKRQQKKKKQLCPSVNQFGFMASAKNTDYRRTGMAAVVGDDCVFFPLTLCLWCERQIIKEKARWRTGSGWFRLRQRGANKRTHFKHHLQDWKKRTGKRKKKLKKKKTLKKK